MIKKIKFILITLLIMILPFSLMPTSLGSTEQNGTTQNTPLVGSPSCILIESNTGEILYEKNANEVRYPASTTKIMTAILVLEKCKLTDVATVSRNAIASIPPDYVIANIREGEQLTIEQLLNVLLIPSANDAAIVLAEHISGSVSEFSKLMNEKAKELGCKNTHFVNPNGIHNKNHVSTAYDLALIAKYAMKNSTFRQIVKKTKYTLPATNKYEKTDRNFFTTNKLLVKDTSKAKSNYYYADAIGVKTGYTGEAGNCLVSSAKKDDLEVIAVVLGAQFTKSGLSEKFLDSITLLNYAFDNYSIKTLQKKNNILQKVEVSGATKETKDLEVLVKNDIKILSQNNENLDELKPEINLNKLKAPITAGTTIGKITYNFNGKAYSSDLIAKENVLSSNFLSILLRVSLIIITLYLLYLLLKPKNNKKEQHYTKKNKKTKKSKKGKHRGNYKYTIMNNF